MIVNEPEIALWAVKSVKKLWGYEFWLANNEKYCAKFLKVIPGFQSSIHAHAIKDETFIGYSGTTQLNIHDVKGNITAVHAIHPGMQYRLHQEVFHSFQAVNVSWILEISTPHSDNDVIRLQKSRKIEP